MRALLLLTILVVLGVAVSSCQGFLEDYNFQPPVGTSSSNPS